MVKVRRGRDGGIKRVEKVIKAIGNLRIEVGYFNTAKYPDGTPVAYVAAIQEWGYAAGGIPPRATIRPTIAEKQSEWGRQIAGATSGAIDGNVNIRKAYEAIGAMAAGDIGKKITQIMSPPLKSSTIRARQSRKKTPGVSAKPLVDTGLMLQSVTHKVTNK